MKRTTMSDLELQHLALDREIHRLHRRGMHMTPAEQERAHELKKARLVTKDRLAELGRLKTS